MQNLVNFPELNPLYEDSGEGGLEVWLVVKRGKGIHKHSVCWAGEALWPSQDVVVSPKSFQHLDKEICKNTVKNNYEWVNQPVDLAMLIASTKKSLHSLSTGECFKTRFTHLTPEGKQLFRMLTQLYGERPAIVTLLDT
jgi:hypothetical protein